MRDGISVAVERHAARIRPDDAPDDLDQFALARTILAEDGVDRMGRCCEGDFLDRHHAAKARGDVGERERRQLQPAHPYFGSLSFASAEMPAMLRDTRWTKAAAGTVLPQNAATKSQRIG